MNTYGTKFATADEGLELDGIENALGTIYNNNDQNIYAKVDNTDVKWSSNEYDIAFHLAYNVVA